MKKMLGVMLTLMCASSVLAFDNDDSIVRWKNIAGVITAPGVDNPVGGIRAGAGPWSVRSGRAQVNLVNGATSFDVDGLVLNGSNSSGTPGPVTAVTGTLVLYILAALSILSIAAIADRWLWFRRRRIDAMALATARTVTLARLDRFAALSRPAGVRTARMDGGLHPVVRCGSRVAAERR